MSLDALIDEPWQVTLWIDRVATGWAIAAQASWLDEEILGAPEGLPWHEWWLGVSARGRTRWRASSAAEAEEGLVDDMPGVDALWVAGGDPVEVVVAFWIRLFLDDGQSIERAFRATHRTDAAGEVDLALAPVGVWHRPQPLEARLVAPRERVALHTSHDHIAWAVLPGVGLIEQALRDLSWVLTTPAGRAPLAGFERAPYARPERLTTGPDGRAAVVWSYGGNEGWHLHLYRLPQGRPHAIIPPSPRGNGNTPHAGVFSDDGRTVLLPTGYDQIGLIDHDTGAIIHLFPAGGYVGEIACARDGDHIWIAGDKQARCHDAASGRRTEQHPLPPLFGRTIGFNPRARRCVWHESFDREEPLSSINWYDLAGTMGQLLVPDALDEAPLVFDDGSVLVRGRAGLWLIEPEPPRLLRVTGELRTALYARPFLAQRHRDVLTVWTTDPTHYQLVIDLPPADPTP